MMGLDENKLSWLSNAQQSLRMDGRMVNVSKLLDRRFADSELVFGAHLKQDQSGFPSSEMSLSGLLGKYLYICHVVL